MMPSTRLLVSSLFLLSCAGSDATAQDVSSRRVTFASALGLAVQERRIGALVQAGPVIAVRQFALSLNGALFIRGRVPLDTILSTPTQQGCDPSVVESTDPLPPCGYTSSAAAAIHVEVRRIPSEPTPWSAGVGYRAGVGPDDVYAVLLRTFERARLARLNVGVRVGFRHTSLAIGQSF